MTSTKCKLPIESYAFSIIQEMMGSRQRGIGQIVSRAFNDLKSHLEHHPDWRRVRDDMGLKTYAEWEAIHAAKCQAEREAAQAAEHQAKVAARNALYLEKEAAKRARAITFSEARVAYRFAATPLRTDLMMLERIHHELLRSGCENHRFHRIPWPKSWPDGVASAKVLLAEADRALSASTTDVGVVYNALASVNAVRADLCKYVDAMFAGGMPDDDPGEIYNSLRDNRWSGGRRPRHPSKD